MLDRTIGHVTSLHVRSENFGLRVLGNNGLDSKPWIQMKNRFFFLAWFVVFQCWIRKFEFTLCVRCRCVWVMFLLYRWEWEAPVVGCCVVVAWCGLWQCVCRNHSTKRWCFDFYERCEGCPHCERKPLRCLFMGLGVVLFLEIDFTCFNVLIKK